MSLEVGDLVSVAGIPKKRTMTVTLSTKDFTACGWFDNEDHYQEQVFRTTNLTKEKTHE